MDRDPLGGSTDTPEEGVCCPRGICTCHYVGTENDVRRTLYQISGAVRDARQSRKCGALADVSCTWTKLKHETKTPLDAHRLNFLKPDEKFDIIGTKSNFTYDEFVEFLCKAEAAQSRALIRPHDTDGDGYLSGSEKDSWDAMAQKVQQKMILIDTTSF